MTKQKESLTNKENVRATQQALSQEPFISVERSRMIQKEHLIWMSTIDPQYANYRAREIEKHPMFKGLIKELKDKK